MQDERAKSWRVQAVSVAAGSFENRKSLPAAWMGLRDAQLSETSGIPDCVFVHASGAALLHSLLADLTNFSHTKSESTMLLHSNNAEEVRFCWESIGRC